MTNKNYIDRLRRNVKQFPGEWHDRRRYCARRILTAVCFRETSQSTFQKTDSALLPPIGFYYAVFHIGIAMLSFDYSTAISELRIMNFTSFPTTD